MVCAFFSFGIDAHWAYTIGFALASLGVVALSAASQSPKPWARAFPRTRLGFFIRDAGFVLVAGFSVWLLFWLLVQLAARP